MSYVFVSPMLRCRQTAEILFPQIPQIEIDPWREMDFGEFEGKNYAQLNGDPRYQAWIDSGGTLAFPGGESRERFYRKMCGWDGAGYGTDPAAAGIQSVSKVPGNGRQRYDTGAASGGGCGSRGTIMALLSHYCGGDYFSYQVKMPRAIICACPYKRIKWS